MPVALVDFEALLDGELISLQAGPDHVCDGHELVRRFPRNFGPDATVIGRRGSGGKPGRRVVSRRAVTPRPKAGMGTPSWRLPPTRATVTAHDDWEIPELRATATPTVTVRLSSFARRTIDEELTYSRELLEMHDSETGGWLFGQRENGVFNLGIATRLGSDGRRKPWRVKLDYGEAERVADRLRYADNSSIRFAGSWHTHPEGNRPSDVDRRSALAGLEECQELRPSSFFLSLILTADRERGWSRPHFAAWATRRTSAGTSVTEPARIVR